MWGYEGLSKAFPPGIPGEIKKGSRLSLFRTVLPVHKRILKKKNEVTETGYFIDVLKIRPGKDSLKWVFLCRIRSVCFRREPRPFIGKSPVHTGVKICCITEIRFLILDKIIYGICAKNKRQEMVKSIISLIFLLIGPISFAQTIRGVVQDTANIPVSYATVMLYLLPDTTYVSGTITDTEGKFELKSAVNKPLHSKI